MTGREPRKLALRALSLLTLAGLPACEAGSNRFLPGADPVGTQSAALNGSDTFAVPEMRSVVRLLANGNHLCTGTVVGKREVLTAGHCASRNDITGSTIEVRDQNGTVLINTPFVQVYRNLESDSAIVMTADDLPAEPIRILPESMTDLAPCSGANCVGQRWVNRKILMVGAGGPTGVKKAGWCTINGFDPVRHSYHCDSTTVSVCGGDSGGPDLAMIRGAGTSSAFIRPATAPLSANQRAPTSSLPGRGPWSRWPATTCPASAVRTIG